MSKSLILTCCCVILTYSQERLDTIYTMNKTIVGKVKEVGLQDISYWPPTEDVVYRVYKRAVLSITFSSGRKEVFNEAKNLQPLKDSNEWEKVAITYTPEEVAGLTKIDFVSVKASGATVYSSVTNTQNRAFLKMQQAAAILGGNIVLISNQAVEGNQYGQRTTRTQLTGIIYRSFAMDTAMLAQKIGGKSFGISSRKILTVNSAKAQETSVYPITKIESINDIELINGIIYLNANLGSDGKRFIVTRFDDSKLILAYRKKSRFVELTLKRIKQ